MIRTCWPLILVACGTDHQGTAVGNPGNLDVEVVNIASGVRLDAVDVTVLNVLLTACRGENEIVPVVEVLDALAPTWDRVSIPAGEWCGATLRLDNDLGVWIAGTTDEGTAFTMTLAVGALDTLERFEVNGSLITMELDLSGIAPGAIDALGDGTDIAASDPVAVQTADAARDRANLAVQAATDTAHGVMAMRGSSEAGCGCSSAPGSAGWLALAVLALTQRRRLARRQEDDHLRWRSSPCGSRCPPDVR